jgi:hypothetical protein
MLRRNRGVFAFAGISGMALTDVRAYFIVNPDTVRLT